MNKTDILSELPSVDEVRRCAQLADLRQPLAHDTLVGLIRESINQVRRDLLGGREMMADDLLPNVVALVRAHLQSDAHQVMQPVINATGMILHTNLGRAPLAQLAIERMQRAAAYTNLELDLETGKRCHRATRIMKLLAHLTGAEDALVVNNCAGATVLALQCIASGREVIISRGQLVEIGGGFRLPDVFQAAGVLLREVGTTNRTYVRDYENAIGSSTGAIIRVHRSNFAQIGFVSEPSVEELVAIQRPQHVPIIDDIGSGCLYDLAELGLQEPTVTESVRSGADVCLFSGDKLFGGPQCGIIVGRKYWLGRLRESPMMRVLRADKVTLAALEATVEIHVSGQAFEQLPVLRMITRGVEAVRQCCIDALEKLSQLARRRVSVIDCESQIGGGTLPGQVLPSSGLAISGPHLESLAKSLRLGVPAILCRLADDRLVLDLRTVAACEINLLVSRLNRLFDDDPRGIT